MYFALLGATISYFKNKTNYSTTDFDWNLAPQCDFWLLPDSMEAEKQKFNYKTCFWTFLHNEIIMEVVRKAIIFAHL